jgi:hypothetical protein
VLDRRAEVDSVLGGELQDDGGGEPLEMLPTVWSGSPAMDLLSASGSSGGSCAVAAEATRARADTAVAGSTAPATAAARAIPVTAGPCFTVIPPIVRVPQSLRAELLKGSPVKTILIFVGAMETTPPLSSMRRNASLRKP